MQEDDLMKWLKVAGSRGLRGKRATVVAHVATRASNNPGGAFTATQVEIARDTGTKAARTVRRAIEDGVAAGILEKPVRVNTRFAEGGQVYRVAGGALVA